jgi:protein-tyrosine kinase
VGETGAKLVAQAASADAGACASVLPIAGDVRVHSATGVSVDRSRLIFRSSPALQAEGYLPEATQEKRIADQYRSIKRPILQRMTAMAANSKPAEGAQLLMVTSALPGDGKTFTSINLAQSIAREQAISALLVDADFIKPHISRILGAEQDRGLMDVLVDESLDVESLVRRTDVNGLGFLPAGRRLESTTELLAGPRLKAVMARLSACDPRRLILLDTAPLLLSNDSRELAQVVRQIVLVVRSGSTPQPAVKEAISRIDKEKLTGLVLNQNSMKANSYYGYSGYGYQ